MTQANGLSALACRRDLQGVKGPTKSISHAFLWLMTPTSVQLGDAWILKTVVCRFLLQVSKSHECFQDECFFAPVLDRIPCCGPVQSCLAMQSHPLGCLCHLEAEGKTVPTYTQPFAIAMKKDSPVFQDLLSQGTQSTFHDAPSPHGSPSKSVSHVLPPGSWQ